QCEVISGVSYSLIEEMLPLRESMSSSAFRDQIVALGAPDVTSPVTVNLEQNYLSGAFSELIRLGEWLQPNPLENMRKFTIAE
ncbi:hypothetical protein MJM28_31680, partial [Salmonella enterica subsp. enterica serovar Montevideo]|nr:hypothetical protein [Salmonella enterica subsp. enterica serovar Montevideo]